MTISPVRRLEVGLRFWVIAVVAGERIPAARTVPATASALLDAGSERSRVLQRAIEGSAARCPEVIRTFKQGADPRTGGVFWNATCFGGRSYAVLVNNDATGSTRVLDCIDLKQTTQQECFTAF